MQKQRIAKALASAAVAGPWTVDGLRARLAEVVSMPPARLDRLAGKLLAAFVEPPSTIYVADLAGLLVDEGDLVGASGPIRRWFVSDAPAEATVGEFAAWLGLAANELDWFSDARRTALRAPPGALRHYASRWVPKRAGGMRLVEVPKANLRAMQRRILRHVLEELPTHDAAHGFVRGRSALTHASRHVEAEVVVRLDLRDFFAHVSRGRVKHMLETYGVVPSIAEVIAGLCTTATPRDVLSRGPRADAASASEYLAGLRRRLAHPHLPQGAPTSPCVANLCLMPLDARLAGAARHAGSTYSRYADDLVFSGPAAFARRANDFIAFASGIVEDAGFHVHRAKTRVVRKGGRQLVTGLVVNAHLAVPRREREQLEAILTNCVRHGPASQNREGHDDFRAHLRGRIAHVAAVRPAHAAKLLALFARIAW